MEQSRIDGEQQTQADERPKDIFKELESRELTNEELIKIQKQIENQRRMFEQYEEQEKQRKINEIQSLFGELSAKEATKAIDLCEQNEEMAITKLTGDFNFVNAVKAAVLEDQHVDQSQYIQKRPLTTTTIKGNRLGCNSGWAAKPGRRPRKIDITSIGQGVFVGKFKGKLGSHQQQQQSLQQGAQSKAKKRVRKQSSHNLSETDEESDTEGSCLQQQEINEDDEQTDDRLDVCAMELVKGKRLRRRTSNESPLSVDDLLDKEEKEKEEQKKQTKEEESEKQKQKEQNAYCNSENFKQNLQSESALPDLKEVFVQSQDFVGKLIQDAKEEEFCSQVITEDMRPFVLEAQQQDMIEEKVASENNWKGKRSCQRKIGRSKFLVLQSIMQLDQICVEQDVISTLKRTKHPPKTEIDGEVPNPYKKQKTNSNQQTNFSQKCENQSDQEEEQENDQNNNSEQQIQQGESSDNSTQQENTPPMNVEKDKKNVDAGGGGDGVILGRAISKTGHTCRGRVRQKSSKKAELIQTGSLRFVEGWFNAGYIFPEGFKSKTLFRSSVDLDQLCVHECCIIGRGGKYWPTPTFQVVALDRPKEPLYAKSCTGCWTQILKRINSEIEGRRKQGQDLPPPPKTAIAGPEYFGLNQPDIVAQIEKLDPERKCRIYWEGKGEREAVISGRVPLINYDEYGGEKRSSNRNKKYSKRNNYDSLSETDDDADSDEIPYSDDDDEKYNTNKWSVLTRASRYKLRRAARNNEQVPHSICDKNPTSTHSTQSPTNVLLATKNASINNELDSFCDFNNPLPNFVDPITLEAVVNPAISPYGHVMGINTWKAVLEGTCVCPFTKQPLKWESCKRLTVANIDLFRDKIIHF